MIEVFKTNVENREQANLLLKKIHSSCRDHYANFDLEDIDRILRVRSTTGAVCSGRVMELLIQSGFFIAILPGDDNGLQEHGRSMIVPRPYSLEVQG